MGILDGLSTDFKAGLDNLIGHASLDGVSLRPLSGYRDENAQRRAIEQVAARNRIPFHEGLYQTGIPGMAAPVGKSMHQHGTAIDWDVSDPQAKAWLYKNAPQYGFRFPLPGSDAGHMQLGGPVEQQPSNVPAYASPQLQPAAPGGQRMAGGLLGDFGNYLERAMTSPMFTIGASTYGAASNGGNWAHGMAEGAKTASTMQQLRMAQLKEQRQMEAEARQAQMWQEMSSGQKPAWAEQLPPGVFDLAIKLGPQAGMSMIQGMMLKNADRDIDIKKLDVTREDLAIRRGETATQNAAQRQMMEATEELRRQQTEKLRRDAEEEARIMGRPTPVAPQPRQPVAPPAAGPQYRPGVRPQSDEAPVSDPNLIQAQAVEPQAPQAQPPVAPQPAAQPRMIQVPRTEEFPEGLATPEQAMVFGQRLLTSDRYRPLGQQILKQVEAAREQSGLTTGARTEIEKSAVGDVNHLARLNQIDQAYDAEYLKLPHRLRQGFNATAEIFGAKLSDDDKAQLTKLTEFRRQVAANFNLLLKEASGTAVTESELKRMMLQEPNAEMTGVTGLWDSSTTFEAKLKSSKRDLMTAIARKNYMLSPNGMKLAPEDVAKLVQMDKVPVSLGNMPGIMKQTQQGIIKQLRIENPRASDEELLPVVKQRMKGVFGI
jgi:hypothetical protein